MEDKCEFCWGKFKNLEQHQKSKYCQNYKYVIFTCCNCNFITRGIKNIDNHIKNCNNIKISTENTLSDLQKRNKVLENENKAYQNNILEIKKLESKITKLTTMLQLERFKSKIYHHIIEQNTNIRIDNVLLEEEDGIHVYNIQNGNIPLFIHEHIKKEEKILSTIPPPQIYEKKCCATKKLNNKVHKSPEKNSEEIFNEENFNEEKSIVKETDVKPKIKKQTYRTFKSSIELVPEVNEEKDTKTTTDVNLINTNEQKESFNNLQDIKELFKSTIFIIKQQRNYTKILNELREKRWNIFGNISITEYLDILNEHISTIETIFKEKKYTIKKSTEIILNGLSPLESRLVSYGNYMSRHLEVDEIQKFNIMLDINCNHDKEYVQFDDNKLCENFYNYGIVLFSIRDNIHKYLFNRYGFNNVVYIPLLKNTTEDPYSFYVLEKVNKEKLYWKMDCRLEVLSTNIIYKLLPYMISMFRKLYKDVYGDNDFRDNYSSKCQLTECDCEQLLQNIILLGQPKEFCNILRDIVKIKATYYPSENDKINLYGDDSLQRKRFQEKEEVDLVDIIKQLFDGISSEKAVDFYRSKLS